MRLFSDQGNIRDARVHLWYALLCKLLLHVAVAESETANVTEFGIFGAHVPIHPFTDYREIAYGRVKQLYALADQIALGSRHRVTPA